jgi:Zn-dependent alcohol dehydrogenase
LKDERIEMKIKDAVLRESNKPLSIEEVDLAPPECGDLLYRCPNKKWVKHRRR